MSRKSRDTLFGRQMTNAEIRAERQRTLYDRAMQEKDPQPEAPLPDNVVSLARIRSELRWGRPWWREQ